MENNTQKNAKLIRVLCTTVLAVIAVFWLIPIFWMIINSFKTNQEFLTGYANIESPADYIKAVFPSVWNFGSYTSVFTGEGLSIQTNLTKMVSNSMIVSVTRMITIVLVSSLSAYAYERLDFPVGDKIFWTLFYISLIPNIASTLPLFKICNSLGWVNSLNALIWPGCTGVMSIFMMRNFFKGIPKEMDEAARIDGASSFGIYWRIMLPSIVPVLMIEALAAFRGGWNDYFWPSIVMTDPTNQTLTAGLMLLQNAMGNTQYTNMLASTVVSMIVPFVLYLCCQKYFLNGIKLQGAVKG